MDIARVLHNIHKVEFSQMAVLTPYSAQKEEIKKLADQAKLTGLKVASITESQGKPPNCIILSCHEKDSCIHEN